MCISECDTIDLKNIIQNWPIFFREFLHEENVLQIFCVEKKFFVSQNASISKLQTCARPSVRQNVPLAVKFSTASVL